MRISDWSSDVCSSDLAGGQWYPSLLYDGDAITPAFEEQLTAAASYAYQRYQIMIGDDYGVRWMTNYQLSSSPPSASRTDRLIAGMLPESKLLPPGTSGFNSPYVSRFTGLIIEPPDRKSVG